MRHYLTDNLHFYNRIIANSSTPHLPTLARMSATGLVISNRLKPLKRKSRVSKQANKLVFFDRNSINLADFTFQMFPQQKPIGKKSGDHAGYTLSSAAYIHYFGCCLFQIKKLHECHVFALPITSIVSDT